MRLPRTAVLLAALTALLLVAATACGSDDGPSEQQFREADQAIADVIAHLEAGDRDAAVQALGPAHAFIHELEEPLTDRDPELFQKLTASAHMVEQFDSTEEEMMTGARDFRRYLREAASAFGYDLEG